MTKPSTLINLEVILERENTVMLMKPFVAVGLALVFVAPAWGQQIVCNTQIATTSEGQSSSTGPYNEPATFISFSEGGVESVSSPFCDIIRNSGVSREAIFVSCSYDVRAFDVTISVERYTGKFTKVIIIDPNRPTYTMAFGSCALAQQQF